MKKLILSVLAIASLTVSGYCGQALFDEYRGLNTEESEILLPSNKSPDMDNVDISIDGLSLWRRSGQDLKFEITYPTHTVKSIGTIKNAIYDRLIVGYGEHVELIDKSYSSTGIIHSSATVGYTWDFAQHLDKTYATNGTDTVFYTDGDSKTFITSAPKGRNISFYNSTCFISNVTDNRSRLYYGVYADPTDWTSGTADTDGNSVEVAGYGEQIMDTIPLHNSLLVLCSNSIMKVVGRGNPYQVLSVDTSVGCKSKGSVTTHLGEVYFAGTDSQFYVTDGTELTCISEDDIESLMETSMEASQIMSFYTITSEDDFESGISSYTSTSDKSGSVVLESGTTIYTTAANFESMTLSEATTKYIDGELTNGGYAASYQGTRSGGTEIYGNYEAAQSFTTPDVSSSTLLYALWADVIQIGSPSGLVSVEIYTNAGGVPNNQVASVSSDVQGFAANPLTTFPQEISPNTIYWLILKFAAGTSSSNSISWNRGGTPGYAGGTARYSTDGGANWISFGADTDFFFKVYATTKTVTGTTTSEIIDTELKHPIYGTITTNYKPIVKSTVTYYVRSSTSATMSPASAWTAATEYSATASSAVYTITSALNNQYIQLKSSMTSYAGAGPFSIKDITLNWSTTGYYITPEITAVDIQSWGLFEKGDTQTSSSATITYFMYSSNTIVSDAYLEKTATWTAVTDNSIIGVSTNTYAWVKSLYDISVGTQAPSLDYMTVNWNSGSAINSDITAMWRYGRMYIGCLTTAASSLNDKMFVYDEGLEAWWHYTSGIYPAVLHKWDNDYLVASSTRGLVAQMFTVDTDLGSNIDAYYKTKTQFLGTLSQSSSFDKLSFLYDSQDAGYIAFDYYLNGSAVSDNTITLDQVNTKPLVIKSYNLPHNANAMYFYGKISNVAGSDFSFHILQIDTTELPERIINK